MTSVARTLQGHNKQLNRAYRGMADELKRKQATIIEDVPMTAAQYECIIEDLRQQLADAEALINDMRRQANSDAPAAAVATGKYDTTATVAKRSSKSISTICRNAVALEGIQLQSGDWAFPAGTIYASKRGKSKKQKAK